MSSQKVDASVLIPVLNEERDLLTAATAMLAQRFDGTIEYLFIDGGSTDGSLAILDRLAATDPRVRVLANPARRTPHALNLGLRAARGEYIVRMDAHAIYPVDYVSAGVERLRRGDVVWVSGPQLASGAGAGSARIARALASPFGRGGAGFRESLEHEREVDTGFTGVWRRDLLVRNGGWDEEWINDQDVELAARLRQQGGRIVCIPEMAAEYVPRATLRALARQYHTYGIYRVKTAQRHPETLRRSQLLPPAVVMALAGTVLMPTRPARTLARGAAGLYALGLLASGLQAARAARRPADAVMLPAIWSSMHLSYGAGILRGCTRFGIPTRALGHLAGWGPARR